MKYRTALAENEGETNILRFAPITNQEPPKGKDWLWELPIETHFLAHENGMYVKEFTLKGKQGNDVVYLIEHVREGKLDLSENYWVISTSFSRDYSNKGIIND